MQAPLLHSGARRHSCPLSSIVFEAFACGLGTVSTTSIMKGSHAQREGGMEVALAGPMREACHGREQSLGWTKLAEVDLGGRDGHT